MLTGLFPATSGSALVNGCSISDNISGVRSSLGEILYCKTYWFFHFDSEVYLKKNMKPFVQQEYDFLLEKFEDK